MDLTWTSRTRPGTAPWSGLDLGFLLLRRKRCLSSSHLSLSTADICPVSTEDICPVPTAVLLVEGNIFWDGSNPLQGAVPGLVLEVQVGSTMSVRSQIIENGPNRIQNRPFGPKQRPNESYGLSGPIRTTPEAKNGLKNKFLSEAAPGAPRRWRPGSNRTPPCVCQCQLGLHIFPKQHTAVQLSEAFPMPSLLKLASCAGQNGPKWIENRLFGPKQRPNESYGLSRPIRTTPEAKNCPKTGREATSEVLA